MVHSVEASAPKQVGGLELSCMNECNQVAFADNREMLVLAHLKAGAGEQHKERAPVAITAVVDRSGSMAGAKLMLLKETMGFVISQLKETDKFGVISYDDHIREDLALTLMNGQGKAAALAAMRDIQPGGSTNLSGGLFEGLNQQQKLKKNVESLSFTVGNDYESIGGVAHKWTVYARMDNDKYIDNVQFLLPEQFAPNCVTVSAAPFQLTRTSQSTGVTVQVIVTFKQQFGGQTLVFPHVIDATATSTTERLNIVEGVVVRGPSAKAAVEYVSTVWMLTDGNANHGITDTAQLITSTTAHLRHMPATTLYTFGFGSDHNAKLLQELAAAGSGIYYFVQNANQIGDSFSEVLGGLVSVVAQGVALRLRVEAPAKLVKVMTAYPCVTDGNTASIQLRDMYADEERDIVALVHLPSVGEPLNMHFAKWQLSYGDVVAKHTASVVVDQAVERPTVAVDAPPPRLLDQQRNRLKSTAAMAQARTLADADKLEDARKVLNACIEAISQSVSKDDHTCVRLIADLRALLDTIVDRPKYAGFGQYAMNAMFSAHSCQRSAGAFGSSYSTPQQQVMIQCQQGPPMSTAPFVLPTAHPVSSDRREPRTPPISTMSFSTCVPNTQPRFTF